jgi:hypothetical protein
MHQAFPVRIVYQSSQFGGDSPKGFLYACRRSARLHSKHSPKPRGSNLGEIVEVYPFYRGEFSVRRVLHYSLYLHPPEDHRTRDITAIDSFVDFSLRDH